MKNDQLFLEHIVHEIDFIQSKIYKKTIEDLHDDEDLQHMITRALEIIGEASKKISPELKNSNPMIPWKEMSGLRIKLYMVISLLTGSSSGMLSQMS